MAKDCNSDDFAGPMSVRGSTKRVLLYNILVATDGNFLADFFSTLALSLI